MAATDDPQCIAAMGRFESAGAWFPTPSPDPPGRRQPAVRTQRAETQCREPLAIRSLPAVAQTGARRLQPGLRGEGFEEGDAAAESARQGHNTAHIIRSSTSLHTNVDQGQGAPAAKSKASRSSPSHTKAHDGDRRCSKAGDDFSSSGNGHTAPPQPINAWQQMLICRIYISGDYTHTVALGSVTIKAFELITSHE